MALSLDGMASALDAGSTRVNSAQDHALKNSVKGGDKTVILDKDSPLVQIFYQ